MDISDMWNTKIGKEDFTKATKTIANISNTNINIKYEKAI